MLIIFWKEFWILSEPDKISPALAMTRMPLICCLWLRDVSGSCTEAFRALCPVLRPREGAKSEWTCRICDQGALDSLSIQNPIQREGKTPEMGRGCAARGGSQSLGRPGRVIHRHSGAAQEWRDAGSWGTRCLHTNQGPSALTHPQATRSPPELDY